MRNVYRQYNDNLYGFEGYYIFDHFKVRCASRMSYACCYNMYITHEIITNIV